jgi:hypothetical protein
MSPGSLPKGNLDINGYKKDINKNVNPNIKKYLLHLFSKLITFIFVASTTFTTI